MSETRTFKQALFFSFLSLLLALSGILLLTNTSFIEFLFSTAESITSKQLNRSFWIHGIHCAAIDLIILSIISAIYFYKPALISKKMVFAASLALAIHFYYEVSINAVNMPLSDDFEAAMVFLNNCYSTNDSSQMISLIGSQYYETRLVILRSACLLYTMIAGEINFKILVTLASLLIAGIAYLLMRSAKIKGEIRFLFYTVIILLLFQFQYHSGIFFLTAGMPKFCTLFFSIAAFYFISTDNTKGFILALFCTLLAALSFGNGMICFFICLVVLLYKKRYLHSAIWSLTALGFLLWYFYDYTMMLSEPISLSSISRSFLYGLIFLGNSMQFFYTLTIPMIAGILIWCAAILFTVKKYYK